MHRTRLVLHSALLSALLFLPLSAMAQTPGPFCSPTTQAPPPVPFCPACNAQGGAGNDSSAQVGSSQPGERSCPLCQKSPAYVTTGVYEVRFTDLQLPAPGFPLFVGRYYNTGHLIDGPTGIGWTSSFHARLHESTYLYAAPSTYQRRAEVIYPDGAHLEYVDDGTGHFTPPTGRYDTLVRNVDGTFDLTLQRTRSVMHFNTDGSLASLADDYGNVLSYTYDVPTGRLQRIGDGAGSGRYLDLTWGPNGRISSVADNTGRTVQYAYNPDGTLASFTNAANQITTFAYVTGRFGPMLSQIKDHWNRVITDLTWDAQGRLNSYTDNGETYTYAYNNVLQNRTVKTDSTGAFWVHLGNSAGIVIESDPPPGNGGAPATGAYNADGTIQLATDEVGVKTFYTYTTLGRVASVTKDYQGSTSVRFDYTYDPAFLDKVTSIIPKNPATNLYDSNWQGWQYDYYQMGSAALGALFHVMRLRSDGFTTDTLATYTYNTRGQVTSVTDATGAVTDYTYDLATNLGTVTSPSNNDAGTRPATTYGYDPAGRVTSVLDPMLKTTSYAYDALDRITTVTLPPPVAGSQLNFTTTSSYDNYDAPSGLTFTNVTDPNLIVTKQGYDQFARLRKSIDGLNNATTYGYTRDLLTSITDANNNVTSYQYNPLKRLTATIFPNSAQESYSYYADGLLLTKTDPKNQTITYTYDNHKRLIRKAYPNSSSIQYTYTGQKLTQVVDNSVSPSETHTFGYDDRFRVNTNTQATRGTLTYTYDDAGRTATTTLSGGPASSYTYYPEGSVNTITWSPVAGVFKYAYNARGQYQTITFPNGQTRAFTYDDQGRLMQGANSHPIAGNLATYSYGYDFDYTTGTNIRLGQRTSMTADVPSQSLSGALTKYSYDTNYQLVAATYPSAPPFNGDVSSWSYDGIGNRTSATMNGTTTTYTYQKIGANPLNWQRLVSAGTTSFTYDNNGNTATMTGNTFGTDYENRQTSVTGSVTASYTYDYQGRRTSKSTSATTTYIYDGLNLIHETGTSSKDYLFGPGIDEPLAMSAAGTVSNYATDGLGSIAGISDVAGSVLNSYAYDAWGVSRSVAETVPQPFRYTGRETGEVPAQQFYRARYYQSDAGRFLSEDPLRYDSGSTNWYAYVLNAPASFTDPRGLKIEVCCRRIPGTWVVGGKQHCFVRLDPPISTGAGSASSISAVPNPLNEPFRGGRKLCKIRNYGPDYGYRGPNCKESIDTPKRRDCIACMFNNFPSGRAYDELGDNSNEFARSLIHGCGLAAPPDATDPDESPGRDRGPVSSCSP